MFLNNSVWSDWQRRHRVRVYIGISWIRETMLHVSPGEVKLTSWWNNALGSIACVNADIVKRQISRPHLGPVTALPQPYRDRKLFLAKDSCDSMFSNESKSNSSPNHRHCAKRHLQLRGGNRDPGSPDCCHHTAPIGILAEQSSLHQVRGRNGLGHLSCLRYAGCSGHLNLYYFANAFAIAADCQCQ